MRDKAMEREKEEEVSAGKEQYETQTDGASCQKELMTQGGWGHT